LALVNNTTGNSNSALGNQSLQTNTIGELNTAMGYQSLNSNTNGHNNSAYGAYSLYNNLGGQLNTASGISSLQSNSTGNYNTANGASSLESNSSGSENTASGFFSLHGNTTGNNNTAFGRYALGTNTTGHYNTALGSNANVSAAGLNNATAIGNGATVNASNKIRLGNAAVTVIEGQVAYTFPSDGRFKTNVDERVKGLDFIMKLRPVVYNFQTKKYDQFLTGNNAQFVSTVDYTESERLRHNGFIAQEVEQAAKESGYEFDGVVKPKSNNEAYGLSYSQFVVPLVKGMQEQQQQIESLQKENTDLKKRLEKLEALLLK